MLATAVASAAEIAPVLSDDIPAQPLAPALHAFADRTGLQLVYLSELARNRLTHGATRGLPVAEALAQLLAGSGLTFKFIDEHTVSILAARDAKPAHRASGTSAARGSLDDRTSMGAGLPEEVIVTATRRDETQGRVPLSLAVWTSGELEAAGIHDLPSLASLTPGVELDAYYTFGPGIETNISIRGVNAKDGSTTGIYLDDTPIPTDRASVFGRAFPFPFDLERIEVLRGPQGVLAGEGAEGGLVRFVTKQPDLDAFDATARAEASATAYGAPSFLASVAAGGPVIAQEVGLRVAASSARLGGYVDRVSPFDGTVIEPNANRERRDTLQIGVRAAPSGTVTLTPAFYYQSSKLNDTSSFLTYLSDPGRGILHNGHLVRQWAHDRLYVASFTVRAALRTGELVTSVAYLDRLAQALEDMTDWPTWQWPNPLGPEYPVAWTNAVSTPVAIAQHVLSAEARLTSRDGGPGRSWIVGASYRRGRYSENQIIADALFADAGNASGVVQGARRNELAAVFGDLQYPLGSRLTASAGLRIERASYTSREILNLAPTPFQGSGASTETLPRLSLAYTASPQETLYLSLGKGYRMGGSNYQQGLACPQPTPAAYAPDSVWSAEIGTHSSDRGGRVRLDGAVYVARWNSLQTEISNLPCGVGYTTNAGAASGRGVDLGLDTSVTPRLRASLTAAYVEAHYTRTVLSEGAIVVGRGDVVGAVPLVPPPWSVTAAGDYEVHLPADIGLHLHLQDVYHSRNPGPFTSDNPAALVYAPTRTPNPATNRVDVRIAASRKALDVALFVNNLLNRLPVLDRRNWTPYDTLFDATTFRPRTTGVTVQWRL